MHQARRKASAALGRNHRYTGCYRRDAYLAGMSFRVASREKPGHARRGQRQYLEMHVVKGNCQNNSMSICSSLCPAYNQ